MGIAGLLPALKSIQKTKHLSEFKGQTVAIDAYVWLHKGVYSCATELATGKPTHKYVDYAMHRVRLLRHFGIEPYIVFDGGPLPAKKGTESERKQRREENLSRGEALTAQGKHSQARDCFVKCVDVTPQMAYQFIKALRAENVKYIVAPYEADAQLAYLERVGIVSAILTEDSDLLVFGCQNVLFKLDHVANTVCHISRSDFGSVMSTASESSCINLHGWTDTQFRAMAILSGCDYLPSISGIGLKTANNLLRKWKTAEAVVRAVMLEGKKNVPNGYLRQFKLAEKCFRFQRVYDPLKEKLVHLTEVEGEWDEEIDAYVGSDMDPELARRIAKGDADPVTHQPMKDINPSFKPRGFRTLKTPSDSPDRKAKGKGKAVGGIFNFFGPDPIIPREKSTVPKSTLKPSLTGTSSGKRRLGEIMDQDLARGKQRLSQRPQGTIQSKFFSASTPGKGSTLRQNSEQPLAGPSRIPEDNKENICIIIDDDDDEEEVLSNISCKANVSPTQDLHSDFGDPPDGVEQEDGYMSPFSTYSQETQELSSPVARIFTPLKKKKRRSSTQGSGPDCDGDDHPQEWATRRRGQVLPGDEFDVDPISSPISTIKKRRRSYSPRANSNPLYDNLPLRTPARSFSMGNILVADTPAREQPGHEAEDPDILNTYNDVFGPRKDMPMKPPVYHGPDLQSCLGMDDREAGSDEGVVVESEPGQGSVGRQDGVGIMVSTMADSGKSKTSGVGGRSGSISGLGQRSGSESGLGLGMKSGSVSPLSPLLQTPADGASASAIVITSTDAGDGNFADMGGAIGRGREKIIIDVDALEMEMMEREAEMEVMQTEAVETEMEDPEETSARVQAETVKAVSQGWRMKWALGQLKRNDSSSSSSTTPVAKPKDGKASSDKERRRSAPMTLSTNKLRRNETNVTPLGQHSLAHFGTNRPLQRLQQQPLAWSVPPKVKPKFKDIDTSIPTGKFKKGSAQRLKKRSSLVFFAEDDTPVSTGKGVVAGTTKKEMPKPKFREEEVEDAGGFSDVEEIVEVSEQPWTRLNQFRYR